MAKREHGSGTWKKRTNGTWELRLSFGRGLEGELIRKSFYGKTKRICQEKAEEFKLGLHTEETVTKDITLGAWLNKWLATYKKNTVTEGTYSSYLEINKIIQKHKLSTMKMIDIRPMHIAEFINDNQEYSSSVLKKLKFILNAAFEDGIDNDLCYRNPVRKVALPKKEKVERDHFTEGELKVIYDFCKTDEFGYIVEVLLRTGIRSGELRALKWNDFDFDKKILTIERAVKANREIGVTKNGKVRIIPITNELIKTLDNTDKSIPYVLGSDRHISKETFTDKYNAFFKRLREKHPEVRHLTAHCCRHTYASNLHEKGIQLKYIQTLLGHSDIQTTGNIYTHADIEDIRKAIETL